MALLATISGIQVTIAQDTIHISFDALPAGTILGEQFAPLGVHFLQSGRYDIAFVLPSNEVPGTVRNIGLFNRSASLVGILFDRPVEAFSVTVAVNPLGVNGSLYWAGNGLDYPTTANYWDTQVLVPPSTWVTTPTFTTTALNVRLIEFGGVNILGGSNHATEIYFTDLNVTFIPEPSTTATLALIGAPAALLVARRRKS